MLTLWLVYALYLSEYLMKHRRAIYFYFVCIFSFIADNLYSEEIRRIEDNSFMLEEAYNQEEGVVQHISGLQYQNPGKWNYTFTQEWPVPGQTHQLSYSIPLFFEPQSAGIMDIMLNYRFQAIRNDTVAFSPRFSVILPTGNYIDGRGDGAFGVQAGLPLSLVLGSRWVTHFNLGVTYIPHAFAVGNNGPLEDKTGLNFGASVIFIATDNLNFMLESVVQTNLVKTQAGEVAFENSVILNPGIRYAIDIGELQIVPGISVPFGIGPSWGEYGVFIYLSFEHPMFKVAK